MKFCILDTIVFASLSLFKFWRISLFFKNSSIYDTIIEQSFTNIWLKLSYLLPAERADLVILLLAKVFNNSDIEVYILKVFLKIYSSEYFFYFGSPSVTNLNKIYSIKFGVGLLSFNSHADKFLAHHSRFLNMLWFLCYEWMLRLFDHKTGSFVTLLCRIGLISQ